MISKLKIVLFIAVVTLLWSCSNDKPDYSTSSFKIQVESFEFTNPGDTYKLVFNVSPADAFTKNGITASNCNISIISTTYSDLSGYFTTNGLYQNYQSGNGEYSLTVTDKNESIYGYNPEVKLLLSYKDKAGKEVEVKSNTFTISMSANIEKLLDSDLPVVSINTPKGQAITSKDVWVEEVEMTVYNPDGSIDYTGPLSMKGRGNTTWEQSKKPYALKLDKKDKILGMPKHKRWVLLANYYDKSNLRTDITFYLGKLSEPLKYTPRTKFANYVMNGEYQGLYIVTEQLKIDENRVSFGDNNSEDGFLMEIDFRAGEDPTDVYFSVPHLPNIPSISQVVIKDPDVVSGDENYNYVVNYLRSFDTALFSDDWLDEKEGYKSYIDLESFVDWYIVNEIVKNNDSAFRSSCYMNLEKDGKLKMGPLWDYDLALGNYPEGWGPLFPGVNSTQGFFIKNVTWFNRMFNDPEFILVLKDRFNLFYDSQEDLYNDVRQNQELIKASLLHNDNIWHFYSGSNNKETVLNSHTRDVENMIEWLKQRFAWMKSAIEEL